MPVKVRRRDFLKMVGAGGVAATLLGIAPPIIRYIVPPVLRGEMPRSQLVWEDCSPVKASELEPNTHYLFYYPLVDTINVVLKLVTPSGKPIRIPEMRVPTQMDPAYEPPAWLDAELSEEEIKRLENFSKGSFYTYPPGVGPDGNIVAYNLICQHLGCPYPALRYYPPGTPIATNPPEIGANGGVLHCLCHGSAYDPSRGAIVLTPPTVRPQPAVKLEWDPNTDYLYAVDMVGPTINGKVCNTCGKTVGDKVVVAVNREPEKKTC
ncbi:MAG: Rieske 2Fe-2S domain-containing protein [Aeropyrum sp.]|nr:Rieske 2Fe-2S domain-containing protein [Aeropyrum sp.]MCE4615550.1 Rieske 2Fe-2S domain-containing protein [Aeropyrum sp.]